MIRSNYTLHLVTIAVLLRQNSYHSVRPGQTPSDLPLPLSDSLYHSSNNMAGSSSSNFILGGPPTIVFEELGGGAASAPAPPDSTAAPSAMLQEKCRQLANLQKAVEENRRLQAETEDRIAEAGQNVERVRQAEARRLSESVEGFRRKMMRGR